MVDATQKLQASLAEEHRLHMMFQLNITQRIGKPMQAANVIVQARHMKFAERSRCAEHVQSNHCAHADHLRECRS